jgi:hypothetical protein
MRSCIHVLAVVTLVLVALAPTAQTAPGKPATQSREKADLVVVGQVYNLTFTRPTEGKDGMRIRCLAEVVVTAVERGGGALIGEKLSIRWTEVVRKPGRSKAGGTHYLDQMKADDVVRFWLRRDGKDWTIIQGPNGIENLTVR